MLFTKENGANTAKNTYYCDFDKFARKCVAVFLLLPDLSLGQPSALISGTRFGPNRPAADMERSGDEFFGEINKRTQIRASFDPEQG